MAVRNNNRIPSPFFKNMMKDRHILLVRGKIGSTSSKCANDVTLPQTLEDIGEFIHGSYDMDSNPLFHLRKRFDNLEWKYQEPEKIEDILRLAHHTDYAWLAFKNGEWTDVVTARVKSVHRNGAGSYQIFFGQQENWGIRKVTNALKSAGVCFVTEPSKLRD